MKKIQQNKIAYNIIIIGTGFAGLASAIRLKQTGEGDFILLERSDDVDGVWRDNQYPGCACDVQSHLYSLSFIPNANWSRKFSPQPEIFTYLKNCAKEFELYEKIKFHHEVTRMKWVDSEGLWHVTTSKGLYYGKIIVGAFGALSDPLIPKIKGMEKFQGEHFHSARWPKDFNPKGKKVAVIGTGASAIQFIPEIQREVSSLTIFQRTPPWVIPRMDNAISSFKRGLYQQYPLVQKLTRLKIYSLLELRLFAFLHPKRLKSVEKIALKHMHKSIKDPDLREKLTPNYRIGCKRILLSDTYYPALAQPNVEVHTNGIAEVEENAIVGCLGNKYEVDAIIFGTGFQVTDLPFAHYIFGREGHSLSEEWKGSPKAYMGTTITGFPNLFLLQGPNTGLGHSSVIYMMEAQIEHMLKTIKYMKQNKLDIIEPHRKAQNRFVYETDRAMKGTVWTAGGCSSWYLDKTGRNSTLWPGYTFSFRRKLVKLKIDDYVGRSI